MKRRVVVCVSAALLLQLTALLQPATASPTTAWFEDSNFAWVQQQAPLSAATVIQNLRNFLQVSLRVKNTTAFSKSEV